MKINMDNIIDGKLVASEIKKQIKEEVDYYVGNGYDKPVLTAILVGDDPASQTYVRNKEKACNECGFESRIIRLPVDTTQEQLNDEIRTCNNGEGMSDGVIVQLPLPNGLNADYMEHYPYMDVDGFTRKNMGQLVLGEDCFKPATPYGITMLLDHYNIPTEGKNVVIIGRSNIVGKPMANLLMNKPYNANVTVLHSKTNLNDMKEYCSNADIIIVAVGIPKWFNEQKFGEIIKSNLTIIDVGMDRDENGKLCGDVDYDVMKDYCEYITPVPGGVGPMTVTALMMNTMKAYKKNKE